MAVLLRQPQPDNESHTTPHTMWPGLAERQRERERALIVQLVTKDSGPGALDMQPSCMSSTTDASLRMNGPP